MAWRPLGGRKQPLQDPPLVTMILAPSNGPADRGFDLRDGRATVRIGHIRSHTLGLSFGRISTTEHRDDRSEEVAAHLETTPLGGVVSRRRTTHLIPGPAIWWEMAKRVVASFPGQALQ